jgi:preprotein translocase subunit SecA
MANSSKKYNFSCLLSPFSFILLHLHLIKLENNKKHNIMNFSQLLAKLFGTKSQRDLKEIMPYIDKVKAIAEEGFYKDVVDRSEDNITFCILSFSTKPYEIMTATNGHDKSLVERINYIYSHDKEAMNPIIGAMYFRDKKMADIEGISEKDFHHDFDSFCESFLMTICDDNDLKTIINFVRLKNNKGQTLYADGWV